ncbi:hypothetical protein BH09GEM1_BH09GEM1_34170 [soil metagenome]
MRQPIVLLSFGALLLSAPLVASAQGAKSTRAPAPTMEALIKATGEAYKISASGSVKWYVVTLVSNGKGASVGLSEDRDWLGQAGLAKGRLEIQLISLSAAPTAQLLKAVAAFNNKLPYGSVIVDETGAYYVHDFIMNGLTADVLGTEIGAAFYLSQAATKEFSAYIE